MELLVVMAIMGLVAAMAAPSLSTTRNQMKVSEASHSIAQTLGEIRSEAIRIKAEVRVTFTTVGLSWDLFNDGSIDGSYSFPRGVTWNGSAPTSVTFDGLGLARALTATKTMTMKRGKSSDNVYLNKNGYIWL